MPSCLLFFSPFYWVGYNLKLGWHRISDQMNLSTLSSSSMFPGLSAGERKYFWTRSANGAVGGKRTKRVCEELHIFTGLLNKWQFVLQIKAHFRGKTWTVKVEDFWSFPIGVKKKFLSKIRNIRACRHILISMNRWQAESQVSPHATQESISARGI